MGWWSDELRVCESMLVKQWIQSLFDFLENLGRFRSVESVARKSVRGAWAFGDKKEIMPGVGLHVLTRTIEKVNYFEFKTPGKTLFNLSNVGWIPLLSLLCWLDVKLKLNEKSREVKRGTFTCSGVSAVSAWESGALQLSEILNIKWISFIISVSTVSDVNVIMPRQWTLATTSVCVLLYTAWNFQYKIIERNGLGNDKCDNGQ